MCLETVILIWFSFSISFRGYPFHVTFGTEKHLITVEHPLLVETAIRERYALYKLGNLKIEFLIEECSEYVNFETEIFDYISETKINKHDLFRANSHRGSRGCSADKQTAYYSGLSGKSIVFPRSTKVICFTDPWLAFHN